VGENEAFGSLRILERQQSRVKSLVEKCGDAVHAVVFRRDERRVRRAVSGDQLVDSACLNARLITEHHDDGVRVGACSEILHPGANRGTHPHRPFFVEDDLKR
jgi:hypothetical protein